MLSFRILLLCLLLTSVFACSSIQQSHIRNFKMVFFPDEGVVISGDDIEATKVDLIHVKYGERAIVTMALAFINDGQYKWVSRDGVMLVTQGGRIVKTQGLNNNLLHVSAVDEDPLAQGIKLSGQVNWQRTIDLNSGDFSLPVETTAWRYDYESVEILGYQFATYRVEENVLIQHNNYHYRLTNDFWFDRESGQLLRSSQQVSHLSDPLIITYLHRAQRLGGPQQ